MSRHHLPLKPSPLKNTTPELGSQSDMMTMKAHSRVIPSNALTKFLLTTLPSELNCSMDVNSLAPSSVTTRSSQTISRPMHLTCMEDNLNRPLAFGWEQLLKVNADTPKLPTSLNILERMGLGNQMLMVR